MARFLVALLVASSLLSSVLAAPANGNLLKNPRREARASKYSCRTNAECLRDGQALLKPAPSKKRSALSARASASFTTCTIKVSTSTTLLGYIDSTAKSDGLYTITTTLADALAVTMPSTVDTINNLAITAATRTGSYVYLAGQLGQHVSGTSFSSTSYNYAYLTAAVTALGQVTPTTDTTMRTDTDIETDIWEYDSSTAQFIAFWTNSDASTSQAYFFYTPTEDYLGLTGSISEMNSNLPDDDIEEVYFTCA